MSGISAPSTVSRADIGEVKDFCGEDIPAEWLNCDGKAISRTIYADLFAVLDTTYGKGDESTTFNLPNFQGRAVIGEGYGKGLTPRNRGEYPGKETHSLTPAENAVHTHIERFYEADTDKDDNILSSSGRGRNPLHYGAFFLPSYRHSKAEESLLLTSPSGKGAAHNNVQPCGVAKKIIYTGV